MDQIDKIKIINDYKVKLLNRLNDDIDKDEIIKSWQKYLYKGYVSSSRPKGEKIWNDMTVAADRILLLPIEEIKRELLPDNALRLIEELNTSFKVLCIKKIDGDTMINDNEVITLIDKFQNRDNNVREFNKESYKKYEKRIEGCIDYLLYDKIDNFDEFLMYYYNLKKNRTVNGKKKM